MDSLQKMKLVAVFLIMQFILFGQTTRWVFQYNGPNISSDDFANSVIYGTDGNIYAAGRTNVGDTLTNFIIVSNNNTGALRWVYSLSLSHYRSSARSLVYGADNNIYAVGYYDYPPGFRQLCVISLTNSGTERWSYTPNLNGYFLEDRPASIIYGQDGNIYVSTTLVNENSNREDIAVISLTASGSERWTYTYNGPANSSDFASAMVADSSGNIYVAGSSMGVNGDMDIVVIQLSSAGTPQWVSRYNSPFNGNDFGNSICIAPGQICVAGTSFNPTTSYNFFIISLFPTSGGLYWVYSYNGPGNSVDMANSITYGADGWIYAAGFSTGLGTKRDFTVVKVSNGILAFIYRFNGESNSLDCADSIVYGSDGNIYAAGYSISNQTKDDIIVISLTNTGTLRWTYLYDDIHHSPDAARSIIYGADGNIYCAGYSFGSYNNYDFTIISLGTVKSE